MMYSRLLSSLRCSLLQSGHPCEKSVTLVKNVQARTLFQLVNSCGSIDTNSLLAGKSHPQVSQVRFRIRDLREDFRYFRDRPLGPLKHRPPNKSGTKAVLNISQLRSPQDEPSNLYRRHIHYPEDGKYTIKKLPITKMGGRHPQTGRKVIEGVGGGAKQKYRWVDWFRVPKDWPRDGSVLKERVITVNYDPVRKAMICLTGYDEFMRWQIATTTMKPGDIISTYTDIPDIPIRPKEGDSHPLGALPLGTMVCLVEAWPGEGTSLMRNAEESAKIMRKVGDRIVIKCWEDEGWPIEYSVPKESQCVVGEVSIHPLKAMAIGSPNRMRWLGMRPRSGLWKRKDGTRGRKIKRPPPAAETVPYEEYLKGAGTPSHRGKEGRTLLLHCKTEATKGAIRRTKFDMKLGDWPEYSRNRIEDW